MKRGIAVFALLLLTAPLAFAQDADQAARVAQHQAAFQADPIRTYLEDAQAMCGAADLVADGIMPASTLNETKEREEQEAIAVIRAAHNNPALQEDLKKVRIAESTCVDVGGHHDEPELLARARSDQLQAKLKEAIQAAKLDMEVQQ